MRTLLLSLPALAAAALAGNSSTTAPSPSAVADTGDRPRLMIVDGRVIASVPDSVHGALACPMPVHVPSRLTQLPDSIPGRLSSRTRSVSPTNVSGMPIARSGCYNPLYTSGAPLLPDTAPPR